MNAEDEWPVQEPAGDRRCPIPDGELVERAVRNAGRVTSPPRVRWAAVQEVFATGSTWSIDLCRRHGLDPHETVGLEREGEENDPLPVRQEPAGWEAVERGVRWAVRFYASKGLAVPGLGPDPAPEERIADRVLAALRPLWPAPAAADSGPGELQVGVKDGDVVINLDQDRTGHIVFSPEQAVLLAKAADARCEGVTP